MCTERLDGSLYTKIDNAVAVIEFGHPAANSFPTILLERLVTVFNSVSNNDEVVAIVLRSEGNKTFCGGASFKDLLAITTHEEGIRFFNGFARVLNAMRVCKKPIIARVQGKVVGGGLGLIAACDYVFATEAAAIKLSELSLGIGPFVIAPALERKIGIAALQALSYDPTCWQNAYWAKEKGLYNKVFDTIANVDEALDFYINQFVKYNPEALMALKKVFWEASSNWETLLTDRAAVSGKLVLSEYTQNALKKYRK